MPVEGAPNLRSLDVRGQLGKTYIYYHNPSGPCIRAYNYVRTPIPPPYEHYMLVVYDCTAIWHTLDQATQNTWAKLARRFRLPKYTAYIRCNLQRHTVGLDPVTVPP